MRCLVCKGTDVAFKRATQKLKFGWVDIEYCKCRFCKSEFVPKDLILRNDERVRKLKESEGWVREKEGWKRINR